MMLERSMNTDFSGDLSGTSHKYQLDPKFVDITLFSRYKNDGVRSIHRDLLSICMELDRIDLEIKRSKVVWQRNLEVNVIVSKIEVWKRSNISQRLTKLLNLLTGDSWKINFVKGEVIFPDEQLGLDLQFPRNKKHILPFSDGLDSYCVSGLLESSGGVLPVRVDGAVNLESKSNQSYDRIKMSAKVSKKRETSQLFRMFKFASVAAIIAQITGIKSIVFPESGQGSLGPSLIYQDEKYPDFRNHPVFLKEMKRFIRLLFDCDIDFIQPRLWYTKGQTINEFLESDNVNHQDLNTTRSCTQKRWNTSAYGRKIQCGLCPACLLRRMSLFSAEIEEPSKSYVFSNLKASKFNDAKPKEITKGISATMIKYAILAVLHLNHLAEMANDSESELSLHAQRISRALNLPIGEVTEKLRNLLVNHSLEWQAFVDAQGKNSFLKKWIK